mmetsp:Transcript_105110/g.338933  ORF Transcript_105110/g.338933 Transcript_105110/m.338933 type:complete len:445 (+) Transcript_105110:76-1410(+)
MVRNLKMSTTSLLSRRTHCGMPHCTTFASRFQGAAGGSSSMTSSTSSTTSSNSPRSSSTPSNIVASSSECFKASRTTASSSNSCRPSAAALAAAPPRAPPTAPTPRPLRRGPALGDRVKRAEGSSFPTADQPSSGPRPRFKAPRRGVVAASSAFVPWPKAADAAAPSSSEPTSPPRLPPRPRRAARGTSRRGGGARGAGSTGASPQPAPRRVAPPRPKRAPCRPAPAARSAPEGMSCLRQRFCMEDQPCLVMPACSASSHNFLPWSGSPGCNATHCRSAWSSSAVKCKRPAARPRTSSSFMTAPAPKRSEATAPTSAEGSRAAGIPRFDAGTPAEHAADAAPAPSFTAASRLGRTGVAWTGAAASGASRASGSAKAEVGSNLLCSMQACNHRTETALCFVLSLRAVASSGISASTAGPSLSATEPPFATTSTRSSARSSCPQGR